MTEQEWLACDDPAAMLEFLRDKAVARPLSLFAVSCCRANRSLMKDRRSRQAVEWTERFIDGLASPDLSDAPSDGDCYLMATAANRCMRVAAQAAVGEMGIATDAALEIVEGLTDGEEAVVARRLRRAASILRDVCGNPFGVLTVHEAWLAWGGSLVRKLAEGIYADRAFDRLPILADALVDAGCADEAILSHLRSAGPHVRGCWALDLILGKE